MPACVTDEGAEFGSGHEEVVEPSAYVDVVPQPDSHLAWHPPSQAIQSVVSGMEGIRGPIRVKRLRDDTRLVGRDAAEACKEASCFDAAAEEAEVVAQHQDRVEPLADARDVLYG